MKFARNIIDPIVEEMAKRQEKLEAYYAETLEDFNPLEHIHMQEKLLALKVELGELANATRCFKKWSKKPAEDPGVILEELADCVHFTLAIGLLKNYLFDCGTGQRLFYLQKETAQEVALTVHFNIVFLAIAHFEIKKEYQEYIVMLQALLNLAAALGFDEKALLSGYIAKNEKNYVRQQEGY